MKRLLRAELCRRLLSLILVGECAGILIYSIYQMVLSQYGYHVDALSFLFQKTPIICIYIAVNSLLHIGQELDDRTINNKLYCGFSKTNFYLAEMIVGIAEGMLLTLFDTVSVCVIAKFADFDMPAFDLKFFINLLIVVIITSTVAVISTVLAVLISNRLIAVLVVLLVSFILLYGGRETVSRLNQPKQTTSFNVEGILMDNPLYLEGGSRVLYNAHVFISPYAQACYASNMLYETQTEKSDNSLILKNTPYHVEFFISDIILSLFLYFIGLGCFKKHNLR